MSWLSDLFAPEAYLDREKAMRAMEHADALMPANPTWQDHAAYVNRMMEIHQSGR